MNPRTFGEETVRQWIQIIQVGNNPVREQDLYPLLRIWVKATVRCGFLELVSRVFDYNPGHPSRVRNLVVDFL